jgi:hypothetical protein
MCAFHPPVDEIRRRGQADRVSRIVRPVSGNPTDETTGPPAPGVASGEPANPETARTPTGRPIQYKGGNLEAARGPGLGCFRFQLVVLAILVVLTPISVYAGWPYEVSAGLLFVTLLLLLFAGQTVIFLLRLVAAERRGRRRPLSSGTPTVGELEDAADRRAER